MALCSSTDCTGIYLYGWHRTVQSWHIFLQQWQVGPTWWIKCKLILATEMQTRLHVWLNPGEEEQRIGHMIGPSVHIWWWVRKFPWCTGHYPTSPAPRRTDRPAAARARESLLTANASRGQPPPWPSIHSVLYRPYFCTAAFHRYVRLHSVVSTNFVLPQGHQQTVLNDRKGFLESSACCRASNSSPPSACAHSTRSTYAFTITIKLNTPTQ